MLGLFVLASFLHVSLLRNIRIRKEILTGVLYSTTAAAFVLTVWSLVHLDVRVHEFAAWAIH